MNLAGFRVPAPVIARRLQLPARIHGNATAKELSAAFCGPPCPAPDLIVFQHAVRGSSRRHKGERLGPVSRDACRGVLDAQQLALRAEHARHAGQLALPGLVVVTIVAAIEIRRFIRPDQKLQQLPPVLPELASARQELALLLDLQQVALHLRDHGRHFAVLGCKAPHRQLCGAREGTDAALGDFEPAELSKAGNKVRIYCLQSGQVCYGERVRSHPGAGDGRLISDGGEEVREKAQLSKAASRLCEPGASAVLA